MKQTHTQFQFLFICPLFEQSLLLCTPFIIHFLSTLQSFSASITSIVLTIFIVSFSNESYPDKFRGYTLMILLIEGCCISVHYLVERYQRDVFSMVQLLRGEKNRLKFNKSLMKDLLGSNLKCRTVLNTVSSRMNDSASDDNFTLLNPSYFFPKVSVFSLHIANFEKIVLSSQDKIVLAVLKSVYKAFYENVYSSTHFYFYFIIHGISLYSAKSIVSITWPTSGVGLSECATCFLTLAHIR